MLTDAITPVAAGHLTSEVAEPTELLPALALPASALHGLELTRTTFDLTCRSPVHLEDFIGNALRGDFGYMLRHRACKPPPGQRCEAVCLANCAYGQVFAPRLACNGKFTHPPRPYVIEPHNTLQTVYEPGEAFRFHLVLVGQARESLEFLGDVIEDLGRRGLGEGHRVGLGRFDIAARHTLNVTQNDFAARAALLATVLQKPGAALNLHLLSPTYISQAEQGPLTFLPFWNSLVTRAKSLSLIYGGVDLDELVPPHIFKTLADEAKAVQKIGDTLWAVRRRRDSGTQRRLINAGGLVGSVTFAGNLTPFLPLLCAGEWLHVGKDTVLGNGLYRLSVSDTR